MIERLRTFAVECRRVLAVTKRPDKEEFQTIVKVSALGIAVIGAIGFLLFMIKLMLF